MSKPASIHSFPRIRYSEAFKRHVIEEIDSGRLRVSDARKKYAIPGHETISRWRRRYSKFAVQGTLIRMTDKEQQDREERDRRKQTSDQDRIRLLERALADASLRIRTLETLIDIAEEEYEIPIRKNSGAGPSTK